MKTHRLCAIHPLKGGGFVALDINGCAWVKLHIAWDWERLETPHEQVERRKPGHQKRSFDGRRNARRNRYLRKNKLQARP